MTDKPTLAEIAAMPLPASIMAMRQHYDPNWGRLPEEGTKRFMVKADYSYVVHSEYSDIIEAESREEAEEIATDDILSEGEDCEIHSMTVEELDDDR